MASTLLLYLPYEGPLLAFHLSVTYCILRERRKGNPYFRSNFYTIYLVQAVADVFEYLMQFAYIRLPRYGLMSEAILNFPFDNAPSFVAAYTFYFELTVHVAVALNRYSVIRKAARCEVTTSWSLGQMRLLFLFLVLTPIPGAATRFIGKYILVETSPGIYASVRTIPWSFTFMLSASTSYSLATTLLCLYFESRTLIIYRKLSILQKDKCRSDFLLLLYALLQFAVQLFTSIVYAYIGYGAVINDTAVVSRAQSLVPYSMSLICFSAPICLVFTSKMLRAKYWEMLWPGGRELFRRSTAAVSSGSSHT